MRIKSGNDNGTYWIKAPSKYTGPDTVEEAASVIIPVGSVSYIDPLESCLRSVRWQTHVNHEKIELILVYLHNEVEDTRSLERLKTQYCARIIDTQKGYEHFPLSLARNIGARTAKHDVLVFIDADAVLDPEFLARSLLNREGLVTCWFSYLPKKHRPVRKASAVRGLAPNGQIRRSAYGGGIIAPKRVIEEIHGFDEAYDIGWGCDDDDIVDRLVEHGLDWYNLTLEENIVNLHQWHPQDVDYNAPEVVANRHRYYNLETVVRNEDGWGEAFTGHTHVPNGTADGGVTTVVLHHPLRPTKCLYKVLRNLNETVTGEHVVDLFVQGEMENLPDAKDYNFELNTTVYEKNRGIAIPVNASIERAIARGHSWWSKVDDDILMPPGSIDIAIHLLKANPDLSGIQLSTGPGTFADQPKQLDNGVLKCAKKWPTRRNLSLTTTIGTGGAVFRLDALFGVRMDPETFFYGDEDLCLSIGRPFGLLHGPFSEHLTLCYTDEYKALREDAEVDKKGRARLCSKWKIDMVY